MIHKIYSVRDNAVGAYLPPVFFKSKGEVIRSVSDAVNGGDSTFKKHAQDFVLFELGEFDDNTGIFNLHDAPLSVGVLIEFKQPDA